MSITQLFSRLGARLANQMWSWGAVRASDGIVFLRVWQDRELKIDGKWYTKLTDRRVFADDPDNLGWRERLRHVDLIRGGATCYLVMCECADINASPRAIKSFNDHEVFLAGALIERDGDWWIERVGRKPIRDVAPTT